MSCKLLDCLLALCKEFAVGSFSCSIVCREVKCVACYACSLGCYPRQRRLTSVTADGGDVPCWVCLHQSESYWSAIIQWLLQMLCMCLSFVGLALKHFRHRFGVFGRCMCCCVCCVSGVLHQAMLVQCGFLLHVYMQCRWISVVPPVLSVGIATTASFAVTLCCCYVVTELILLFDSVQSCLRGLMLHEVRSMVLASRLIGCGD
jgi:hypothetical protein